MSAERWYKMLNIDRSALFTYFLPSFSHAETAHDVDCDTLDVHDTHFLSYSKSLCIPDSTLVISWTTPGYGRSFLRLTGLRT